MATKLGRMVTYLDGHLPIKPHHPLMTWSCEIPETLSNKIFGEKLSKDENWLVIGNYKLPSLNDITFISEMSKIFTYYKSTYDSILATGDFNMTFQI